MFCEMNNVVENEIIECPICMDQIEGNRNKVVTECGHCFHTSCLMKNVAHNGFGCPYCRDAMAEEPEDNNSDDDYDEFSMDEEDEEPDYTDNVLRGARWLFQRAEGEELDDDEDTDSESDEEEEERADVETRPPVDYIVEKLVERGVTMADLVKTILINNHDEYQFHDEFVRSDNRLFGKFRIIISNYRPPESEPNNEVDDEVDDEQDNSDDLAQALDNLSAVGTVISVDKAMDLIYDGVIPKGLVVSSNDPDYEKYKAPCDLFFTVKAL